MASYRRRRIIWSIILFTAAILFYVSRNDPSFWSLPQSLKDLGFSPSSSRAGQVALAKLKDAAQRKTRAREIDGLLYFVTEHPTRRFDEADGQIDAKGAGLVTVDPEQAVDLNVYAPDGEDDWDNYLRLLRDVHPLVVFSKTYCPYSQRAKALLETYELDPPPFVVELNTRSDGPIIQKILARLTGRRTVPNILLQGQSIGGSDDILKLHETNELKGLLEKGGLQLNGVYAGL